MSKEKYAKIDPLSLGISGGIVALVAGAIMGFFWSLMMPAQNYAYGMMGFSGYSGMGFFGIGSAIFCAIAGFIGLYATGFIYNYAQSKK